MKCVRCQGLMVKAHMLDFEGGFGDRWAETLRCVNCGHVYDPVIARNRLAKPEPLLPLWSPEQVEVEDEPYLGGEAFVRAAA